MTNSMQHSSVHVSVLPCRNFFCNSCQSCFASWKMTHHPGIVFLFFIAAGHIGSSLAGYKKCSLPAGVGSCKGYFPKWFYNSTSARCEQFIYGGCQGNDNRFDTRESCETTCVCDQCTLQPDTGPCRASIPSYFYNTTSGSCEQFTYGGCGGNDNRFETAAECALHCSSNSSCPVKGQVYESCPSCQGTCDNPVVACPLACTGDDCMCPPGQLIDTAANECVHPTQCPVNCSEVQCPEVNCAFGNATIPAGSCCPVCVCGNGGEAYLPGEAFMIDCNSCSCTSRGLANCTLIACEESSTLLSSNKTRCPIEGQEYTECGTACPLTCKSPYPVPCTQDCVPGCQCPRGTVLDEENNKCVEHCSTPQCERVMCSLQPDTGPCKAISFRYFWNITTRQCEIFRYGGCDGNFNRFSDAISCANQCACDNVKCKKGSWCRVDEPTGQPYCEPSCDLNNGGCSAEETCSLCNVTCAQAPCPQVVKCTIAGHDPCDHHKCPTVSKCKVLEVTGETYCEPSCDLNNGGCAANQSCSLKSIKCVQDPGNPCPRVVECSPKCSVEGQVYTTCGTACPPICNKPQPLSCTQQCVVGCQCPAGTVLDELQNKCVKADECTACPPTCSHNFCSKNSNKNKSCSQPPPHSTSSCPNQCHSTYCNACYYSKDPRSPPKKCNKKVCKDKRMTPECLRRWAKCVDKKDRKRNKCTGDCRTAKNFQCYDYPTCLHG